MADIYPKLLEDREVIVLRNSRPERARLRGWLDGYDGAVPSYRIELVVRVGNYTGPYTATASDLFEALVRLRRQLEPDELMVAVQGARRDTYPSGMGRDMGGGRAVYVLRHGHPSSSDDLVPTLSDAPVDQLATVDDQRAHWQAWLAGPR